MAYISTGSAPAYGPAGTIVDVSSMPSRHLAYLLFRGYLNRIPDLTVATLPAAIAANQGRIITVAAAAGVASKTYVCLKTAANTFVWVQIATG